MKSRTVLFCIILLALVLGACRPAVSPPTATPDAPTATPEPPNRILFIGNSFTYYNEGVDRHMKELAASANPSMIIETSSVTMGGATLESLWEYYSEALEAIREGNWDVVVLQERSPVVAKSAQVLAEPDGQGVDKFSEYASKFDEEIKQIGAQTVLYMTWENQYVSTKELAQVHTHIGAKLGAKVAPVGLAWKRSIQERPDLDLYANDGLHPNEKGTYLATCVLFASIYEQSPVGLIYQPADLIADIDSMKWEWEQWQMTDDEVAFLQRIAWETVVDYQAQQ